MTYWGVDADFLATFGMRLARGESFRPGGTTLVPDVVINENFAALIGSDDVLGLRLSQRADEPEDRRRRRGLPLHPPHAGDRAGDGLLRPELPGHPALPLHVPAPRSRATSQATLAVRREDRSGRATRATPSSTGFSMTIMTASYRSVEREMAIVRTFTAPGHPHLRRSASSGWHLTPPSSAGRRSAIRKVLGATRPGHRDPARRRVRPLGSRREPRLRSGLQYPR
ncbi:MAG: hypothetical protein M0C28_03900 [Candidatus Moduliflexus flocculans]|nr:hypothetical protein [Candidatus Moduliflexus flocculans]